VIQPTPRVIDKRSGEAVTLNIGEQVTCLKLELSPHHLTDENCHLQEKDIHLVDDSCLWAIVRTTDGLMGFVPNALLSDFIEPPAVNVLQNPVLKLFMLGTLDATSIIAKLRGDHKVLLQIVNAAAVDWQKEHIDFKTPSAYKAEPSFNHTPVLSFPAPSGININMMPFLPSDKNSLPPELHGYLEIIRECQRSRVWEHKNGDLVEWEDETEVCYLTISEGEVLAGNSHRRAGLHTDGSVVLCEKSPHVRNWNNFEMPELNENYEEPGYYMDFGWGEGTIEEGGYRGGIFMASTVDDSCEVFDARVLRPGDKGDCEYLRGLLGNGIKMQANELWWMTDRAPHESLPLKETQQRQYFRLVTAEISGWYSAHSTPNPLGTIPPPSVKIIPHDKFTGAEPIANPPLKRSFGPSETEPGEHGPEDLAKRTKEV